MDDPRRSCYRKHRYFTESHANRARRKCEAERGVELRIYFWEYCGGWHLTKTEPLRFPPDP